MKPGIFIALIAIYALILWPVPVSHSKSPTQVPIGEPQPWEIICTLDVDKHNHTNLSCYIPATYLPSWNSHGKRVKLTPQEDLDMDH